MHSTAYLPLNEALKTGKVMLEARTYLAKWKYAHLPIAYGPSSWYRIQNDLHFVVGSPEENKYGIVAMRHDDRGDELVANARFDTFAEAYQYLQMLAATGGV